MSVFLVIVVGLSSILISRFIFLKWFNHVALYSFIWMGMVGLYEIKLIRYSSLTIQTWSLIIGTFLAFILGTVTVLTARSSQSRNNIIFQESELDLPLFADDGRILKYFILLFSFIGIISAIQHWMVLMNKFGSIADILINAYQVYNLRVKGEIEGIVPYFWLLSYVGVFLAGIYTAYKNKLTLVSLLPILAVMLKELAKFSRAGILFGFFEFLISFFLFRHLLSKQSWKYKSFSKGRIIFAVILIAGLMILSAAAVKALRNPIDTFQGTSKVLNQYEGGAFISPSIYLYASAHIGVFNKYIGKESEMIPFGSNTFFTLYSALAKFDVVKRPNYNQRGYFIPIWSNTATYLRDLHADFGYAGLFLIPFLLGLLSTFTWFKFYETHKVVYHVILTHLYLIIALSFFVMVTRLPSWSICLLFLLGLIPLLEKISSWSAGRKGLIKNA